MKIYLKITIAIALICSCKYSQAQWVKLNMDSVHTYTKVFFLNKDTGFICGDLNINPYSSVILKTLDGGDTWDTTLFAGPTFLMDIQFVNDSVGFTGGQDGEVFMTTDLGNSWNWLGYCVWLDDISNFYFFNAESGYSLNFYGTVSLMDINMNPICITNFNSTATTYFPGTGELDFLNISEGYVAGGYGKFLKTFDGGNTWSYFNCASSINIFGAKMTDQNHAVVVGNNGNYSVTNDGGLNWTSPVSISNQHLMDVDFYNNQYGFAVGGFSAPSHWPSSGSYPIGSIWSTSDGGNSWSLVDSSYSEQITDIHIVNDSLAFAVGLNGLVLRNQSHFSTLSNIQENNSNIIFSVYPNPFSEAINVSIPSAVSENHLSLFDLSGKLIVSHQFTGSNFRINTSHLSKGVYFIKIISDNGVATKKLVKVE